MTALKLNIKSKMLLLLLAVAVVGGVASISAIVSATREFKNDILPQNKALLDIETNSQQLVAKYREYIIFPRDSTLEQVADLRAKTLSRVASYLKAASYQHDKKEFIEKIRTSVNRISEIGGDIVYLISLLEKNSEGEEIEKLVEANFAEAELLMNQQIKQLIEQNDFELIVKKSLIELRTMKRLRVLLLELLAGFRAYLTNPADEFRVNIDMLEVSFKDAIIKLEFEQQKSARKDATAQKIIAISRQLTGKVAGYIDNRDQLKKTIVKLDLETEELEKTMEQAIAFAAQEEQEMLEDTLILIIITILATLVISYLCLYWGLSRLTAPISHLQSVMDKFGEGDLIQRASVDSQDEFGQLALAFNNMADQLHKNVRERETFVTQLEQKNTELERFTYTASHDLKSPLVTIKGFLGLLEKDLQVKDEDRVQKDMQQITYAADKMSSLLDDLLELSRIGQVINRPEVFTLNELSEDVLFLLQGAIEKSGAVIEFASDMPPVFADKSRIQEVMQNLLENAIKFSGEDNIPRIAVNAELQENKVLCQVQDNGIGIDSRYQDMIFGLFDRLEVNVEGTGIGLALAQRIIEMHGGEIWIESDGVGRGALFCFTLPTAAEKSNEK